MLRLSLGLTLLLGVCETSLAAIAAKPNCASYTIDTGATYYPDHMWLFCEGTGASVADEGSVGGKAQTITGADWITDGTHGNVLDFVQANSDRTTSDWSTGFPSTSATLYVIVRVDASVTAYGVIVGMADNTSGTEFASGRYSATGVPQVESQGTTEAFRTSTFGEIDNGTTYYLIGFRWNNSDDTVGISVNGGAWDTNTGSGIYFGSANGFNALGFGRHQDSTPTDPADMTLVAAWMYVNTVHTNTDASNIYNSEDPWPQIGMTLGGAVKRRRWNNAAF